MTRDQFSENNVFCRYVPAMVGCNEYNMYMYTLYAAGRSREKGLIHQSSKKVLQLNCKTQLMERDALNQQHVMQCYAIALTKSRRSLLIVGKSTG